MKMFTFSQSHDNLHILKRNKAKIRERVGGGATRRGNDSGAPDGGDNEKIKIQPTISLLAE